MIGEYTECVIDMDSGEVHFWDPSQIRGRGMPGGCKAMSELTGKEATEVLPAFMRRTARALREQEDRIWELESSLAALSPTERTEDGDN